MGGNRCRVEDVTNEGPEAAGKTDRKVLSVSNVYRFKSVEFGDVVPFLPYLG